jgi:hypothetical protein
MANYIMFVCDKCGKETKNNDELLPVWVLAPHNGEWFNVNLREHGPTMELCEKCRAEFKAYFAAWTLKEDGSHAGSPKCTDGMHGVPDCRGCRTHCEDVRKGIGRADV